MDQEIIAAGVVAVALLVFLLHRRIRKRGREKVPQGLQVWDENGNIILDTNDMLGRVLGIQPVSSRTGSITDARLAQGQPFYFFLSAPYPGPGYPGPARITISGSTLSWYHPEMPAAGSFLGYGVF